MINDIWHHLDSFGLLRALLITIIVSIGLQYFAVYNMPWPSTHGLCLFSAIRSDSKISSSAPHLTPENFTDASPPYAYRLHQLTGCGLIDGIDGLKWCFYSHSPLLTWNDLQKHYEPLGSIGIDWDYHLVMAPFGSSWVPATLNLSRSWIAWIAWIGEVITQLVALPDKDSCESFRQLTTVQHGATRWNCFKSNFGRFGVVWCPWCHLSCDSASERESSS
jgi:hypothetical protein